jgi:hypothetical protein
VFRPRPFQISRPPVCPPHYLLLGTSGINGAGGRLSSHFLVVGFVRKPSGQVRVGNGAGLHNPSTNTQPPMHAAQAEFFVVVSNKHLAHVSSQGMDLHVLVFVSKKENPEHLGRHVLAGGFQRHDGSGPVEGGGTMISAGTRSQAFVVRVLNCSRWIYRYGCVPYALTPVVERVSGCTGDTPRSRIGARKARLCAGGTATLRVIETKAAHLIADRWFHFTARHPSRAVAFSGSYTRPRGVESPRLASNCACPDGAHKKREALRTTRKQHNFHMLMFT